MHGPPGDVCIREEGVESGLMNVWLRWLTVCGVTRGRGNGHRGDYLNIVNMDM